MTTKDLGQLPKSDRNDELQELSISALTAALPVDQFILRREEKDKGIDLSIELKIGGACTNFRASIQIKGTASADTNTDGSFSLAGLKVSNVNYLLNGTRPLYVVFIAPRDELRYLWAFEEKRRLDQENRDWASQESVTLRFVRVLDSAGFLDIAQKLLSDGTRLRAEMDILSQATSGQMVALTVDPATLEVTDPAATRQTLVDHGMALVSRGFAQRVLELIELLNPADRELPRILLVKSYAMFVRGRFLMALGTVAECLVRGAEFSPDETMLLKYLRLSCRYQTGQLSIREYTDSTDSLISSQSTSFSLTYKIDSLRHRLIFVREHADRVPLLRELSSVVEAINHLPSSNRHLAIQAKLAHLFAVGDDHISRNLKAVGSLKLLKSMGQPITQGHFARAFALAEQWKTWEAEMQGVIADAAAAKHGLLLADALVTRATMNVDLFMMQRMQASWIGFVPTIDDSLAAVLTTQLDQAIKIYESEGALEAKVRARQ